MLGYIRRVSEDIKEPSQGALYVPGAPKATLQQMRRKFIIDLHYVVWDERICTICLLIGQTTVFLEPFNDTMQMDDIMILFQIKLD
jgi:hypothetical protein